MPPKPPRGQLRLALNGDAALGAVAVSSFQSAIEGIQFIDESPAPTPTASEKPFAEAIAATDAATEAASAPSPSISSASPPLPPPPPPPLPTITVCQDEAPPPAPPPLPPTQDEADGASGSSLGGGVGGHCGVVVRGRSRSCGVGGPGGVGGGCDEDWDRHSVYHQPPKAADRDAAARLAKRLYHLDGFKVTDVAKHLYKRNDFSQLVAEQYVSFFDFSGRTLDQALRLFLSKFALVGETQERERILVHFSKRFVQCNPEVYDNEDDCHALVCALMLLNTDLHGLNVPRKMTVEDFVNNIRSLQNGDKFSLEDLTALYNAIKSEPLLSPNGSLLWLDRWSAAAPDESMMASAMLARGISGHHVKKFFTVSAGSNPFLEMPAQDKIEEYKRGYLFRKSVMDAFGRKSGITKRRWRKYFAVLKDLFLFLYKDERAAILAAAAPTEEQRHKYLSSFVRLHHALSWRIGPSSGSSGSTASSVGGVGSLDGADGDGGHGGGKERLENGSDTASAGSGSSCGGSEVGGVRGAVSAVTRRSHVFQLQTAEGGVFLFQVHSHSGILVGLEPTADVLDNECDCWVERINYVAALLSAPPMSAAVGSQPSFQRHLMPAFRTPCSLRDQLEKHQQRVTMLERELAELVCARERLAIEPKSRQRAKQKDEMERHEGYLQYEIYRFRQYALILDRTIAAAAAQRPSITSGLHHFPLYHCPPAHNTFFFHHHPHPPHRMARHSLRHIDWTQGLTPSSAGREPNALLIQRRHTYDVV